MSKGRTERGYNLADMMSGRAPLPPGVDREAARRVFDEQGGRDAINWDDLERREAAILAREDQRTEAAMDALRDLHCPPGGISAAGMAAYLDSKGGLPDRADMEGAITIRLLKEYGGRLRRPRKR